MNRQEKQESIEATEFLKRIGIDGVKRPFFPLIEGRYIKFMSDSGVSDIAQAQLFAKFMTKKFGELGVKYTNERAFFMSSKVRSFVDNTLDLYLLEIELAIINKKINAAKKKLINAAKKKLKALS